MPDKSLGEYLLKNKLVSFSDWVYHGTPMEGLKEMLTTGVYGQQHGEIAEYETFSTSVNSEVLHYFSEGNEDTGLQFKVENMNVLVLDDIMHHLVIELPGSGMDIDIDEQELEKFCQMYRVPVNSYGKYYLPYGYLTSLGVDAFVFEHTWNRMKRGYSGGDNQESEICFVGKGIDKLNGLITSIYVHNEEFDNKEEALQHIEQWL
jgi:hypothetical protein